MALSVREHHASDAIEEPLESETDSGPGDQEPRTDTAGPGLGLALGLLLAVAGFFIGSRTIGDNSFFTHLANGRLLLDGQGIPRVDPYSFTATGQQVTVQSWLATGTYAWIEAAFGASALRLLGGALAALLCAAIWKLTESLESLIPRLALTGMIVGVGAFMWGPRPTMFGLLGFAWLLLVHRRSIPMWTLIPVMWLWVNTHGSFPLGLVAIGAIGLGHALDHREFPEHEVRVFAWATAGMLLGAINPLGLDLLRFPVHLLGRREALVGVMEWSAPKFDQPLGIAVVIFIGLHIVAGVRGARWKDLLPGFVFLVASLLAVRNLAPATLVFAATLTPYLSITGGSLTARSRGFFPGALAMVCVLGAVVGVVAVATQDPYRLDQYPVEEVDWLEDRDLVANADVRTVHRDTVGNYLHLRYGTQSNVFVDDRFDFYPLDVLEDHRALFLGGDYASVLDGRDADVVLWERKGGFAQWLDASSDWSIAHRSDDWLIACRIGSDAAQRCN